MQFEAFVERVRTAVAAAMPTATVETEVAEARVVRPDANQQPEPAQPLTAAYYDPYLAYYPSPLGFVAESLMWSSLFSMAMQPHYVVVDHVNHVQGFADDPGIQHGPTQAAGDDGGSWWSGDGDSSTAGDDSHSDGSDHADGNGWGDVGGGDDFGGGDLGGGDFGSDW